MPDQAAEEVQPVPETVTEPADELVAAEADAELHSGAAVSPEASLSPTQKASATAMAVGEPIEVVSERTERREVWALPDGTFEATLHIAPERFERNGQWVDVDLSVMQQADGTLAPVAHPYGLVLAGAQTTAGDHDLASMWLEEDRLALGWRGTLPQPVVDGSTVTWPAVKPGVDLVVEVAPTGFEQFLVVHDREGLQQVETVVLPWHADGFAAQPDGDGGLLLSGGSGAKAVKMSAAWMWDARVDEASGEHLHRAPVAVEVRDSLNGTGQELLVAPDADFLADPNLEFPVVIDPSFSVEPSFDTFVQTGYTSDQSGADELKLGTYDGGTNKARSFLSFHNMDFLHGTTVWKATLHLWEWHSWSCVETQWEAWRTSYVTDTARWTNQPTWVERVGTSSETRGYSSSCDDGRVAIDVTGSFSHITGDPTSKSVNIGLRAASETSSLGWKRFNSANKASGRPYAVVGYYPNEPPAAPTNVKVYEFCDGSCVSGAVIRDRGAGVQATISDPEGHDIRAFFEVWEGTTRVYSNSVGIASGETALRRPWLDNGGSYRMRVRGQDEWGAYGPWSDYFYFSIDQSGPDRPVGVGIKSGCAGTCGIPAVVEDPRPVFGATPDHPFGDTTDVVFEVHNQAKTAVVASGTVPGAAEGVEVTWQPPADLPAGVLYLRVRSVDDDYGRAGSWSSWLMLVFEPPLLAVPTRLTTEGVGCLAPAGSRVAGTAPTLRGVPRHTEGTVLARIELRAAGGTENLRSWLSLEGASGKAASWQVDPPLPDGVYEWRMRSESAGSGADVGDWSGWCGVSVDGSLDVEPGPFVDTVECPVNGGEPLEAHGESTALLLASACDAPAEAMSLRDFGSRVLAQPDGNLLAESYTLPQWTLDDSGEWVGVDTSFVADGQGRIATAAAVSEIEVSGGGVGPLVTATDPDGGSVSLVWPEALPTPVVVGDTVTYPEVMADVDLQVTAGVDGFSYVLVVKSAAAAASPELAAVTVGIQADGLQLATDVDGAVVATDAAGEVVFSAPAAYMWDSSQPPDDGGGLLAEGDGSGDEEDVPPGLFTSMPLQLDGATLTVEPDPSLLSDPEAEFPIMIDPPFSGRRMHWANIHQQQAGRGWTDDSRWPRAGGMRVGRLGYWPNWPCGDACGLWRSVIRFDTAGLRGKQIISAAVKATQTHTSGCGAYGLQLWHVDAFRSGTSWNGMSGKWNSWLGTETPASSNRSGGCSGTSPQGVTYNGSAVRSVVQGGADAGHGSVSFGFRSSDESSILPYRRISVDSVKLEVVYNRPAQTPTNLSTDGRGCATSSPGPWLTTQRPTLSGVPRDPDGRVGAHLQIRRAGSSSTYYSWKSGTNRQHNQVVNHRIPSDDRLPSGSYRWRMRSLDNHPQGDPSAWNQWCYFRIDVTSPTTPKVDLLSDPPAAGEQVTLRLTSSDAHSGLAGFSYGVDEEIPRHQVSSTGTAEITITAPASGGRTWIYVWSRDHAGNTSNRAVFDFFAARFVEATPVAAWRLDGDGVDDSGHGHQLTLGSGVAWEQDAGLVGQTSLGFDGTGCVATEGPVVRTDAEYTVAAWVRLDSATGDHAFVTQAGQIKSAFQLKARAGNWRISLNSGDTYTPSWVTLQAPAVVGQWTHLAARVDPAARHVQLYVNGQLAVEGATSWATWNAPGPLHVGCSAKTNGGTWDLLDGAVHHVGVWQGLLTSAQIQAAYQGDLPAGLTGDWQLRGDGADASAHARNLDMPSTAGWVDDQYGRQRSAIHLNGTDWAESTGPILRTDQSFTVAAWAKLDDKSGSRGVVAQGGQIRSGFYLRYHPTSDRWQFTMPSHDASSVTWHTARSLAAPQPGVWYHLVGVYDAAADEVRLYVDGQLQNVASRPVTPWQASGSLLVGASGTSGGGRWDEMVGAISDVKTWRGALTADAVAQVHGGNPAVQWLSQWSLDGHGGDDIGGSPLTLVGSEFVDYEWVEDRDCFPFSALGLQVSGQGHAKTSGPVVTTDESFTVTAWVKPESVTGEYQTVLSQAGSNVAGLYLQATPDGRWRFAMPLQDDASATLVAAESEVGLVQPGQWTHLAGVFDLAQGQVRLYVGGQLVDTGSFVTSPWHAGGPMYLGVAGATGAGVSQQWHGAIDTVTAWKSTLDPDRIFDMARGSLFPGIPCF